MRLVRAAGVVVAVAAAALLPGCGSSSNTPPIAPTPVQTSFTISGNLSFSGVSQQTQLTATAGYSDGTTKNISTSVTWTTILSTVASVSPTGALTTTGLGATYIVVQNPAVPTSSQFYIKAVMVTVTPPGTSAVFGWTREPGSGPLANVQVRDPLTGQWTISNQTGDYSLGGLSGGTLVFTKAGYEDVQFDTTPSFYDSWPLQQVVRIDAGASTTGRLAPHDVDYLAAGSTHCQPCRLVRVTSTAAGTLHLRLTWTDAVSVLNLWVNGQVFAGTGGSQEIVADVPVGVGELLVYFGKIRSQAVGNYVPFTLTTTR